MKWISEINIEFSIGHFAPAKNNIPHSFQPKDFQFPNKIMLNQNKINFLKAMQN